MKIPFALATTATGLLLASCAAPTVNLATPQPIKVDIAVRLDVYQHAKEAAKKSRPATAATDPTEARRNRMADIQTFKNSRLVGEGRDALLAATLPVLRGRGVTALPVTYIGKAATFALMTGFPVILLGQWDSGWSRAAGAVGWAFVIWGTGMYLWSAVLYLIQVRLVVQRLPRVSGEAAA
jgi:hypothetical protein